MLYVDDRRCAYCGGCVPVCPVGALTLQETRLEVDSSCIDCGRCVSACAMGALRIGPATPSLRAQGLGERYDVVVVGAGPAGSMAARAAAEAGLSVLLLEKRQEIGSPVRCAEGVGHEQLDTLVAPDARWIAAYIDRARITAVQGMQSQTLDVSGGRGYVLERRIFDRALAEGAARAGAQVRVKAPVTGLLVQDGAVRAVKVASEQTDGETTVEAAVVIGADGVESQTARWAGLSTALPLADTMVCAQYLLAGVDIDPECTCYVIDHEAAPGGYLWIFPKDDGRANVGLGVQGDLVGEGRGSSEGQGQPERSVLDRLIRFIEGDPRLACGSPVTLVVGNVPVALPADRMVGDGLLLVGDAARQVDPLTGGGITNAMAAGRLAAQVAADAIAGGDTSRRALSRYEECWRASTGRKMVRNYRLRQRFASESRADERFLRAFALAVGG